MPCSAPTGTGEAACRLLLASAGGRKESESSLAESHDQPLCAMLCPH